MDLPAELEGKLTQAQFKFKVYYLVCFWLESLLYGLYFCLFIAALNIMIRKRTRNMVSSRVFLTGIVAMFIIISFHNFSNLYCMIRAYAYATSFEEPVTAMRDADNWWVFAFPLVLALVIWIGDALVIYRCWLIWKKNYWVIVLPVLLFLASLITHSFNIAWFGNPNRDTIPTTSGYMLHTIRANFPLQFAQNILTTSLIAFKIWSQHRKVKKVGVVPASGLNLISIVRIVIESALVYTISMLVMIILYFTGNPAAIIFQHALVPITGMVFLLIAIRTHSIRESGQNATSNSLIPSWMHGEHINSTRRFAMGNGNMPMVTTVTEEHRLDDFTSSAKMDIERSPGSQRESVTTSHDMKPTAV
ncbi:hypothetical protein FA15DRAFT_248708 [Coprinopsis marcescibilis]|uniref:Integral membrane protein n=1 Tax=Coprinopsis marcescibilis TaxID=230819 RepID=A0A5C3KFI6_COPMA|nr:hypothetical protein FA15DRAFT_248708 [Coprinopsis marcescibilis]